MHQSQRPTPTPLDSSNSRATNFFYQRSVPRINLCVFHAINFNWTLFITFNFSNLITRGVSLIFMWCLDGRDDGAVSIYAVIWTNEFRLLLWERRWADSRLDVNCADVNGLTGPIYLNSSSSIWRKYSFENVSATFRIICYLLPE